MTGDPLDSLGERIDALRTPPPPEEGPHQASGMAQAMRIGIELVSATAVGGGLGYALDHWLGTLPLFLIICLLLGMAAGVLTMIRTTQAAAARIDREGVE